MSLSAPKPYHPERGDPPKPFNVEQHQIDVLRDGGRRDALWEFLEKMEKEEKSGCPICKGVGRHEEWCSVYSPGDEIPAGVQDVIVGGDVKCCEVKKPVALCNGRKCEVVIYHDVGRCSWECPMLNVAADEESAICYLFGSLAKAADAFFRDRECIARAEAD